MTDTLQKPDHLSDAQLAASLKRSMRPRKGERLGRGLKPVCDERGWDFWNVRNRLEKADLLASVMQAKYNGGQQ